MYGSIAERPICEEESTYKPLSVENDDILSIKKEGSWISSLVKTAKASNSEKEIIHPGFSKAVSMT